MPIQKCQANGETGYKWGEHGKCYTGSDAKEKAEAQGRAVHAAGWEGSMVLQLQTMPAVSMATDKTPADLVRYRKELIKVGKYTKDKTVFEVTVETLHHWANTFRRWLANGNKVPIPPGHDKIDDPTLNQGWVTNMFVEGDSLFGVMELLDPKLALVTDVSISVPKEVVDGGGKKYTRPIDHVSLCTDPVVGGLQDFEQLSLSLKQKEKEMTFLKKVAKALGITGGTPTEESILLALEDGKPAAVVIDESHPGVIGVVSDHPTYGRGTITVSAPVAKLISENRAIKLSGLVKAGLITPAIKDMIAAQYIETKAVALELSRGGGDGGFDMLYEVLSKNTPSNILDEQTGVQSFELANAGAAGDEGMRLQRADINRRRLAAGLTAVN